MISFRLAEIASTSTPYGGLTQPDYSAGSNSTMYSSTVTGGTRARPLMAQGRGSLAVGGPSMRGGRMPAPNQLYTSFE